MGFRGTNFVGEAVRWVGGCVGDVLRDVLGGYILNSSSTASDCRKYSEVPGDVSCRREG